MEEPDQQDQQAPKPKTRPGEGYTRRIQGKKKLTSVLLQEQLQATQAKLRVLQEQNDLLRMKEALQTRTLEGIELALHQLGTAADAAGGPSTERSAESLLQAVLLDLQALKLKQSLQAVTVSEQQPSSAAGGARPSTEAQEIIANTFASPAARLAAARAAVSAMSSDSGTSSSLSAGSGGSGACDTPAASAGSDPNKRMQQVLFSLTPEEVQAMQDLTLEELAGRLRDDMARVALVRKADGQSDPAEVEKAVLGYMRSMCLSLVANDERHCIVSGMNLETMQHEGMPDSMFEEAVKAAKLLPHQLQQLTIAFQTYSDVQAELLQQQQGIMQQLQLLLGAESQSSGGQASPPGSPSGQHSAATASAGNAVPAPTAGPAHFMSLATGAAVKRAEGHTQQTQQACASTGASVPARSATAAEATSGAQTRSALLKAKAAAAAAGAAAAGGSGGGGGSSSAGQGPPLSQAGACQQALGGQQGQGAGSGCDPPAAAAAGGGSSSGTTPSSSGAGTSSSAAGSSSWLVPEGLLCLEDADKAEQLLLEWQRVAHRMKRQARSLGSMVMNLLACEQLADSMLAGYPFIVPTPRFCAHAIRMAQEQQKALQR